jgi:hypothetical protein
VALSSLTVRVSTASSRRRSTRVFNTSTRLRR